MVTNRLSPLVAVVLAVVLLTSCNGGGESQQDIYGEPPAVQDYLDDLGTFEPFVELIAGRQPTESEYEAIVDSYHEGGLEGLAESDLRVLLAVSQMAFLSHQRTLRYSVVAGETAPSDESDLVGHAVLQETYVMWNELQTAAARRVVGTAIEWRWVSLPQHQQSAPAERIEICDLSREDSDSLVSEVWNRSGTGWNCTAFRDEAGSFAMVALAYLGKFASFAKGSLLAEDTIDQRASYRLLIEGDPVQSFPDVTYWLDAETLWLRQEQYEDDGIHYIVKLEAVNEDIVIEPPDVDVECEEMDRH